jgi:hypothetical protein
MAGLSTEIRVVAAGVRSFVVIALPALFWTRKQAAVASKPPANQEWLIGRVVRGVWVRPGQRRFAQIAYWRRPLDRGRRAPRAARRAPAIRP